jgi:hypothetical protein
LNTAKNNIITAIANKGGTVSQTAGLEDIPSAIATISTVSSPYIQSGAVLMLNDMPMPISSPYVKIGAGDWSSGYTMEIAYIQTAWPNDYARYFEIRHSTGNTVSGSDVIGCYKTHVIDLAVNGVWHHPGDIGDIPLTLDSLETLTLTVDDEQTAKLYVNTTLALTLNDIGTIPDDRNNGIFFYSGCGSTSSRNIAGTIYSARVYNRVLTQSEIAANRAIDMSRAPT